MVTELLRGRKRGEQLVREEIIGEKLERFFHFYDQHPQISRTSPTASELPAMESLFSDVESEVMKEVREVEYPRIIATTEFRNGVLKLPAKRVLVPWVGKTVKEVSSIHRKSRSFFLPSS